MARFLFKDERPKFFTMIEPGSFLTFSVRVSYTASKNQLGLVGESHKSYSLDQLGFKVGLTFSIQR